MIDKELIMIVIITLCVLLGMLGGWRWKWLRRYLLPVLLGLVIYQIPSSAQKVPYFVLSLIIALCLPYGQNTPFKLKILTFSAIFGSTLWLGFSWWQVIGVIIVSLLFRISNTKWGQNIIFWKAWEAITFLLLGITISSIIGR